MKFCVSRIAWLSLLIVSAFNVFHTSEQKTFGQTPTHAPSTTTEPKQGKAASPATASGTQHLVFISGQHRADESYEGNREGQHRHLNRGSL